MEAIVREADLVGTDKSSAIDLDYFVVFFFVILRMYCPV